MKAVIIAEAGVNHNGDFELAQKLVLAAAESGADYVKFQTFKAAKLVTKSAHKAIYQKNNLPGNDDSQFEMLKKLEMPEKWHLDLMRLANDNGIKFLSSGFDIEDLDFLDTIGIDRFKIPSGEITNKPYLRHISKKGKPVILSTGMAYMDEVKAAIQILTKGGIRKKDITILHCNTEYPTPMKDVNLMAMVNLKKEIGINAGYSDHTSGIEVPIAAVALGASMIEKHLTLDKSLPGPDHIASLEPDEFKKMVTAIRNIEMAVAGNGMKKPSRSEMKNITIARKSIVASKPISKGDLFTENNLTVKRPGNGISPMLWDKVIGKSAKKCYKPDELVEI